MKRIFTSICATMLIASGIYAQSFSIPHADTAISGSPNASDFYSLLPIENNTDTSLSMIWTVVHDSLPTEWEYSICDPTNCHPVGVDSNDFTLMSTTANQTVNVHFYPNKTEGEGIVQFKVYEIGKEDSSILVTYRGSAYFPVDTTSDTAVTSIIEDVKLSASSIQVVPGSKQIMISSDLNNFNVAVYNLNGQVVIQPAPNTREINYAQLRRNVYLVRLVDGAGRSLTKKVFIE